MKHDKSHLQEVDQLKTSLLHKEHWYSMYIDRPFKLVIFGAKHLYPNSSFLLLLTGVGKKLKMDGCLDGLLYLKQAQLAVNCCTVVVKDPAKAYANVIRQN